MAAEYVSSSAKLLLALLFLLCAGHPGLTGEKLVVLRSFGYPLEEGVDPQAPVAHYEGVLFGTTMIGGGPHRGTVFRLNTDGTGFRVLHQFTGPPADGQSPQSGLVVRQDETLYGVAAGGANSHGIVFRLSMEGSGYKVLHHFKGAQHGRDPRGLVKSSDGKLYGITATGGPLGGGTIFALATNGSQFKVLHSFGNPSADGTAPVAEPIVGEDGAFYGTTAGGGDGGSGVVYRLNAESDYRVLHRFSAHGRDGRIPSGPLLEVGEFIYGATELGGALQGGTAYRLNRDGSNFRVLHAFESRSRPVGGFVLRPDDALYGVSPQGGIHAGGTIFRLTTNGAYLVVFNLGWRGLSVGSAHGREPLAGLTRDDKELFMERPPQAARTKRARSSNLSEAVAH